MENKTAQFRLHYVGEKMNKKIIGMDTRIAFFLFLILNLLCIGAGIPLILYDPRWSFIGWMVLMIIISPFLQLLTIIFASFFRFKRYFQKVEV